MKLPKSAIVKILLSPFRLMVFFEHYAIQHSLSQPSNFDSEKRTEISRNFTNKISIDIFIINQKTFLIKFLYHDHSSFEPFDECYHSSTAPLVDTLLKHTCRTKKLQNLTTQPGKRGVNFTLLFRQKQFLRKKLFLEELLLLSCQIEFYT